MKIAICDNERNFIENIANYIEDYSKYALISLQVDVFTSSQELLLCNDKFDIVILEAELDGIDGIKLGKLLKYKNPHIILMYITENLSYLDDALELNALRFFKKPINPERFYKGLESAIKSVDNSNINFFLKKDNDDNIRMRVNICDIVFVEIANRKSKIVTKTDVYYSLDNIDYWRDHLAGRCFVSPHKSFVINMNYITAYTLDFVILEEDYIVPISRNNKTKFKNIFKNYFKNIS